MGSAHGLPRPGVAIDLGSHGSDFVEK